MISNEKKRVALNAIVNVLKGVMGIIFPLITFPYVSRVLGVDQLGRYNFANSIISYFVLIAGLGVSAYAVREGTQKRNNRDQINVFAREIFTINVFSTVAAYILLFVLWRISKKLQDYSSLIWIMSIAIVLQTLGVEWIYSVYEKYMHLAIRSFAFQFIALILMFTFVRTSKDVEIYALITIVSSAGANILNFICSRKYCRLGLELNRNIRKHMKPILLLFATSITIIVYVNSDTTILGFLCGDYEVGLYSVSVKIYTILKTIVSSFLVVFVPQIALLIAENKETELEKSLSDVWNALITILLPVITGVIIMSKEILLLISGNEFVEAYSSLAILGISLFFSMGAYFGSQCILIPFREEKKLLYFTILSALINVALNFVLIPIFKQNGAALTTVLAEAIVFFGCFSAAKKHIVLKEMWSSFLKPICGIIPILFIAIIGKRYIESYYLRLIIVIILSAVSYFVVGIAIKNNAIYDIIRAMKKKR